MPKIIPLRELKNASQVSELCHKLGQPVFVTKNGESDLVIMTSDHYDKMQGQSKNVVYSESMINKNVSNANKVAEPATFFEYISNRDDKPLYSIAEIKKTLKPIFEKHCVKKAILFGSYVKGTADTRSDVDLLVETNLKGLAFYGLLGDVSDALRFPVDLIERRQLEKGSPMEAEIAETGVTIYG